MDTRIDLEKMRRIFDLLADVRIRGADALQWRACAVRGLCELTNSQTGWITHEITGDPSHRTMILSYIRSSASATVYQCVQHAHPPINQFFRRNLPHHDTKPNCPVFGLLADLRSRCNSITAGLPLIDNEEMTNIGICESPDTTTIEAAHQQILRLFITELAHTVRRQKTETFPDPLQGFSPRLRDVATLLLLGKTEVETANRLGISRHTVHRYVMDIYRRLQVFSRAELLAKMSPAILSPKITLRWPEASYPENKKNGVDSIDSPL